jgi:hypothetical protein
MAKAPKFTYYQLKSAPKVPGSYTITKFDGNADALNTYALSRIEGRNGAYFDCSCPASTFDCRHKRIMKSIIDAGMTNSGKFFCFETSEFVNLEDVV